MMPIGGYFGMALPDNGTEYYPEAIKLNTGRNGLEYILKDSKPDNVLLPYYTCGVVREPLEKLDISYEYYRLNEDFSPGIETIDKNTLFVYNNYFGLCGEQVNNLINQFGNQLIIDNAQAFFSSPRNCLGTFYSPRKFFGLPDGGYLFYNSTEPSESLEQDVSRERVSHLVRRIDEGAEAGFQDFQENDARLVGQPVKRMSAFTKRLLQCINYEKTKQIRNTNFAVLHDFFKNVNQLQLDFSSYDGPLCYPLLTDYGSVLKQFLIEHKIFVPMYWQEVKEKAGKNSFEYYLANNLVALPIDQRYREAEMEHIINLFKSFAKR